MKRVLVTGANGFIGSHICEFFQKNSFKVIGVDFNKSVSNLNYEFIEADLLNDDVKELVSTVNPDIVIHCAGSADVHKSVVDPFGDFNSNVKILHKILFSMKELKRESCKFIFLSSAAVYGQPKTLPIKENDELNPLSPYALHKKMGEDICNYFTKNYNFDISIVRIFSAYGPGLKKQIFWDMNKKIEQTGKLNMFGTGNESRDYIYITDVIKAIYLVAQTKGADIFNIANCEEIYIKDIANKFAIRKNLSTDKIIFDGYVREGDPINWRADISKLTSIGYKKSVDIDAGIKLYIDWINKN